MFKEHSVPRGEWEETRLCVCVAGGQIMQDLTIHSEDYGVYLCSHWSNFFPLCGGQGHNVSSFMSLKITVAAMRQRM